MAIEFRVEHRGECVADLELHWCPLVTCDVCAEPITEARRARVYWDDALAEGTREMRFSHLACYRGFIHMYGRPLKWTPLEAFLYQLTANSGYEEVSAKHSADVMQLIDHELPVGAYGGLMQGEDF